MESRDWSSDVCSSDLLKTILDILSIYNQRLAKERTTLCATDIKNIRKLVSYTHLYLEYLTHTLYRHVHLLGNFLW